MRSANRAGQDHQKKVNTFYQTNCFLQKFLPEKNCTSLFELNCICQANRSSIVYLHIILASKGTLFFQHAVITEFEFETVFEACVLFWISRFFLFFFQ